MTAPPAASNAARVLIVDDNSANLQFLSQLLGTAGYQTFPASEGELALEFMRATPPDLVLLDVKMPGMDGEEVCRRLKADPVTRSVPVIFISALESEADRVRCFSVGGVDYVAKPFRPEEVLARVETHLALRRIQVDLEQRNAELADARADLEARVERRTAELAAANARLLAEVADRKRAEQEASDSRRFLDDVIDAVADPVFVLDADGRFVRVNDALSRLTGRARDELLGRTDPGIFPAEGGRVFQARNASVLAGGKEDSDPERLVAAGGARHVFLVRRTLYRDPGGAAFLVGVMRDVTDYERMRDQAGQTQRLETIGMLAGGVAHDLNNLLAPILASAETLLGEMSMGHPWYEMVKDTFDAARSGQSLTQRLLAFSRKQHLDLQDLDLGELVRRFEPMIRRTVRTDVALRLEVAPSLPRVRADAAQVQQVIANLVVNARDAMPGGGSIAIGVKVVDLDESYVARHPEARQGPHVAIEVTDTGTGMSPEVMAHLFEPFFTTKQQARASGLGLSSAFGIVKQHGGSISVYSEPGRGSTFQVYLPVAQPEAAAAVPAQAAPDESAVAGGGETLVVAEDDERVRRTTVRTLTALGYRVLEAPDAARCIELVREFQAPIALLVSDVIMPGMHGRELYDALRRLRPGLRVLFMSGYPSAIVGGHDDIGPEFPFIQKPFARRELAAKVRAALAGR
jgi:PAS domain S-box-containing protein